MSGLPVPRPCVATCSLHDGAAERESGSRVSSVRSQQGCGRANLGQRMTVPACLPAFQPSPQFCCSASLDTVVFHQQVLHAIDWVGEGHGAAVHLAAIAHRAAGAGRGRRVARELQPLAVGRRGVSICNRFGISC